MNEMSIEDLIRSMTQGQTDQYSQSATIDPAIGNAFESLHEHKLQAQNQQLNQQRADQMKMLMELLRGNKASDASSPIAPGGGSPGVSYGP